MRPIGACVEAYGAAVARRRGRWRSNAGACCTPGQQRRCQTGLPSSQTQPSEQGLLGLRWRQADPTQVRHSELPCEQLARREPLGCSEWWARGWVWVPAALAA